MVCLINCSVTGSSDLRINFNFDWNFEENPKLHTAALLAFLTVLEKNLCCQLEMPNEVEEECMKNTQIFIGSCYNREWSYSLGQKATYSNGNLIVKDGIKTKTIPMEQCREYSVSLKIPE